MTPNISSCSMNPEFDLGGGGGGGWNRLKLEGHQQNASAHTLHGLYISKEHLQWPPFLPHEVSQDNGGTPGDPVHTAMHTIPNRGGL